jgi:hypothetical protein
VNDPEQLYIPEAVELCFARNAKLQVQIQVEPASLLFREMQAPTLYQVECQTGTMTVTNGKQ